MNEATISQFKEAIRSTHGSAASLRGRQAVEEWFKEKPVWSGEVLIFDLLDHPTAKTCYAWSVDNSVTAVLHEGPLNSPRNAVRAAIVAENRK